MTRIITKSIILRSIDQHCPNPCRRCISSLRLCEDHEQPQERERERENLHISQVTWCGPVHTTAISFSSILCCIGTGKSG